MIEEDSEIGAPIQEIVDTATQFAIDCNHKMVTTEHVFLALLRTEMIDTIMSSLGIAVNDMKKELAIILKIKFRDIEWDVTSFKSQSEIPQPKHTFAVDRMVSRVFTSVMFSGRTSHVPTVIDILHSLTYEKNSYTVYLLNRYCVDIARLIKYYNDNHADAAAAAGIGNHAVKMLEQYCTNLNSEVIDGRIDPIIGRASEIDEITQTLTRKTKSNALLIGDPGVGKAQPLSANILTPSGWTLMGQLQIGDVISTPYNEDTTITNIFPQGEQDVYKLTSSDGRNTECCGEHLWKVLIDGTWSIMSLNSIIEQQKINKDFEFIIPLMDNTNVSREQNMALLEDLIDNYGHVDSKNGDVLYDPVTLQLAKNIQTLVWSIGGLAHIKKTTNELYTIEIKYTTPSEFVRPLQHITSDTHNHPDLKLTIEKIEHIGRKETQCIMVDHPEHLYITDDYIVTHNTAVVEGLAYNIVNGGVAKVLKDCTIYSLEIGSLLAGCKFRGEFEEKVKAITYAAEEVDDCILFVDEAHMMSAGGSATTGSVDFSGMIKPSLSRGRLKMIASTTWEDFRQSFDKDRALMRRFNIIPVEEPSRDDAVEIMLGTKGSYEKYHGLSITEEALTAAVDLSIKYISNRKLPDKSLDLIDAAFAKRKVKGGKDKVITVKDIVTQVSKTTRMPIELEETGTKVLTNLEANMKKFIFGQDTAVSQLAEAIYIAKAGLKDINKPTGSFLFAGPTGVGKAQPLYSKIKTQVGWKEMGQLKVGDEVTTPRLGHPAKISGIFPQGKRPVYTITFSDGRTVDASDEHLWRVYNKHWQNKWKTITTTDIKDYINTKNGELHIQLCEPNYNEPTIKFMLDPYILGLEVRDGIFKDYEKVSETLGLTGLSPQNRFIPSEYFTGSYQQRLRLIQGLMKTGGYVSNAAVLNYYTVSSQLADDFTHLIRSVGGLATIKHSISQTNDTTEDESEFADLYNILIQHPRPLELVTEEQQLLRITRGIKKDIDLKLKIDTVEFLQNDEVQCIMIDDPDHLYITDNYIVTHNTEVCRKLSELFGIELLRYDMSEFMEKHSIAKLIGSPPGYVGFDDSEMGGGKLLNDVEKYPNSIVLFDEIEKAHPDVANVLLQVMDNGFLTGSSGKRVDFRNVIIVMTTNLGSAEMEKQGIGFTNIQRSGEDDKAINSHFPPEFRNRLDAIVKFNKLDKKVMLKIVIKFVREMNALLVDKNINIATTRKLNKYLLEQGFDDKMGARPLARVINEKIKKPMSKKIIFEDLKDITITADLDKNDNIVFT